MSRFRAHAEQVNAKRVYRVDRGEGLAVRRRKRRNSGQRAQCDWRRRFLPTTVGRWILYPTDWRADATFARTLHFIDPSKHVQNAYVETFNPKLRDECRRGERRSVCCILAARGSRPHSRSVSR